MSRLRNVVRSLASGYAAMAGMAAYTLASVPLALHYLSKDEFGLWALVTQIGSYLLLIDLGMSGSVSRILIDHKDSRNDGMYGAVLQTGALVLIVQGAAIVAAGLLLSLWLPSVMDVPENYISIFRLLTAGQCALLGLFFVFRLFNHVLQAHQRFDMISYSQIAQLVVNYAVQWLAFHRGLGLYSLLVAGAAGSIAGTALTVWPVFSLGLLPSKGAWGRPSYDIFKQVFAFGSDLFLLIVGYQLMNASQIIIISRTLGLTAAAVWSIATRTFTLVQQVVARIFDFSSSALGEMFVRGEQERLERSCRNLLILTASAAVFVALSVGVCNGSFLAVWLRSSSLMPSDVPAPRVLAEQLMDHSNRVSNLLWPRLRERTRQLMLSHAEDNVLRSALVDDLNAIIEHESLYDPGRFEGVPLAPATKALLGKPVSGRSRARLNRLLLADAYPGQIGIKWEQAWSWKSDAWMGILLILTSITRCHVGLMGVTKHIGRMRYVYFLEGVTFVVLSFAVVRTLGMSGIIGAAVVSNLLWSGSYGLRRTARYFGVTSGEIIFQWLAAPIRYLVLLIPIGIGVWLATVRLPPLARFLLNSTAMAAAGLGLMWLLGLPAALRQDLGAALNRLRGR